MLPALVSVLLLRVAVLVAWAGVLLLRVLTVALLLLSLSVLIDARLLDDCTGVLLPAAAAAAALSLLLRVSTVR